MTNFKPTMKTIARLSALSLVLAASYPVGSITDDNACGPTAVAVAVMRSFHSAADLRRTAPLQCAVLRPSIALMKARPNSTVVRGRLQKFEPAADGYGGDIEIEVVANKSPDPSADFLKQEGGALLRAFYAPPPQLDISLLIGRLVTVELTFLGGPSGGRAVVQTLRAE